MTDRWWEQAACRALVVGKVPHPDHPERAWNVNDWYPLRGDWGTNPPAAALVCRAHCTVREECLEDFFAGPGDSHHEAGIRGGLSGRGLRRAWAARRREMRVSA